MQKSSPFLQVLSGPLQLATYSLIHTTCFQALKNTGMVKNNILKVIQNIPAYSVSPAEYDEVRGTKEIIELQSNYGSGTFYLVDAQQNQEVFVFHQKEVAQFAHSLLGGNRKQKQYENNGNHHESGQENQDLSSSTQGMGKDKVWKSQKVYQNQLQDVNQQVLDKLQQILETLTNQSS